MCICYQNTKYKDNSMANGNIMWILEYLSECKLRESIQGFSYSRRSRFLSPPVTERQLSARESPYLNFFLLKIVIKREDVASYCELQTRCLVLLQFPRCLETIMALQHLIMFDILLNPQLLRSFERNKYRRRNKHSLHSLTPSWSVTSGVWNHSRERGETLQRTRKRNTQLYKSGACMYLAHSAA